MSDDTTTGDTVTVDAIAAAAALLQVPAYEVAAVGEADGCQMITTTDGVEYIIVQDVVQVRSRPLTEVERTDRKEARYDGLAVAHYQPDGGDQPSTGDDDSSEPVADNVLDGADDHAAILAVVNDPDATKNDLQAAAADAGVAASGTKDAIRARIRAKLDA